MRPFPPWLPLLLCLLVPTGALAVVINTGDGSGNTTPPPDDPGFANVGSASNSLTGVYLGNGWVLTARHVGDVDFTFDGIFYQAVPGSRRLISKAGMEADLAMIKLSGPEPPLPPLALASAPIAVGEDVTMIGNGWNREANATCWNMSWVELACPGGVFEGYERFGPRVIRWGLNRVTGIDGYVAGPGLSTRAFEAVFDEAGLVDEAQLVGGDSGGGAFLERSGEWELVGIHFAMGAFMSQPADTAVFGNLSAMADVYHYRPEIEAILFTPPHVPVLPWPALLLVGGLLLGVGRGALAGRRRRDA